MQRSTSTFKHNDRVEALWSDDNEWHPAKVLKVKGDDLFSIRFDGWSEKYDFPAASLRFPVKRAPKAKRAHPTAAGQAAAPPPAPAPAFSASKSGPEVDAQRFFEAGMASINRPSKAADHYAALGLAPGSPSPNESTIKSLHRQQSLKWHTDKTHNHAESMVPKETPMRSEVVGLVVGNLTPIHEEEMRFLNEVKETLTNSETRANYDAPKPSFDFSGLDAFFAGAEFPGGTSGTTFTWKNGDFVPRTPKRNKSELQNATKLRAELDAMRGQTDNAVRAAVADTEARLQQDIMKQAAAASQLRAQVQQLKDAATAAQAKIHATEQQAATVLAQTQQDKSEAVATIAQLQCQVQRLTGELHSAQTGAASAAEHARQVLHSTMEQAQENLESATATLSSQLHEVRAALAQAQASSDAAAEEARVAIAAAAQTEATLQEQLSQAAKAKSQLQAQLQRLQAAAITADAKAQKAARQSTAMVRQLRMTVQGLSDDLAGAQAEAIRVQQREEKRAQIQKVCDEKRNCRVRELEAANVILLKQLAAEQGKLRMVVDLVADLRLEHQTHEQIAMEQAKQRAVSQRCGSG